MINRFILYSFILFGSSSVVLCDELLNKAEGAECVWEGVKGTCVHPTRCLTSLDEAFSLQRPNCSKNSEVCCTDCQLVDDARNAVVLQKGIFWKDGRKSKEFCLQYISQGNPVQIGVQYNSDKKCLELNIKHSPARTELPVHPYMVLLGYGNNLTSVKWSGGGAIISDRFILTTGFHTERRRGRLGYIALGVTNKAGSTEDWKIYDVKRTITHPAYEARPRNNDVALVETEKTIQFSDKIQPACLPFDDANDDEATVTTWTPKDQSDTDGLARKIKVQKFLKDECLDGTNRYNLMRYNDTIHVCYGRRDDLLDSDKVSSGDPLVMKSTLSSSVYTVIGLHSYRISGPSTKPTVYARIPPYLSWIESVVWP